jgi:hypothetical protein
MLHEELGRLPERYRAALVLCHLEGLACEEAARQLGWPVGTVKSRLARGRERLRDRLTRRGLAPSIGLGAALAADGSHAAVPAALADATVQAALQVAARSAAATQVISAAVNSLAGKVVKEMLLSKLRTAAVFTLALGLITAGMAVLVQRRPVMGAPLHDRQAVVLVQPDRAVGEPQRDPRKQQAGGPANGGSIPFQMVGLSADDLVEATGLNLYKYQVDMPKGQRFRVVIRDRESEDAPARVLFTFPFQKSEDGPTTFRVSFLRRDHALHGVLLSEEKDAEFRFDGPGCTPSGIVTIVPLPLSGIEGTRKTCFVHKSDKDNERDGLKEMRLISIVASEPGKPAPPPTSYPRAELVIVKDDPR